MGTYYDNSIVPDHLKRKFDVYDRIKKLSIDMGSFDADVADLKGAGIAGIVFHESGLVFLSGQGGGPGQMYDDPARIKEGADAAEEIADSMIKRLHWGLTCGGEGGDLNDVIYMVKALGMVVSPGGGTTSAGPPVTNGFSFRWHSVFGGPRSDYAKDGVDPGGFAGIHARSAIGGFDGRFSIEPEIILAIPATLAREIIGNRGWVFPLPPAMLDKVQPSRGG